MGIYMVRVSVCVCVSGGSSSQFRFTLTVSGRVCGPFTLASTSQTGVCVCMSSGCHGRVPAGGWNNRGLLFSPGSGSRTSAITVSAGLVPPEACLVPWTAVTSLCLACSSLSACLSWSASEHTSPIGLGLSAVTSAHLNYLFKDPPQIGPGY